MAVFATDVVKYHENTNTCGIVKAVERIGGFLDVTFYGETYRFYRNKAMDKVKMPDGNMIRAVTVYGYFAVLGLDELVKVIRKWQMEDITFHAYINAIIKE